MSLNTGHVKITGDSSEAVKALKQIESKVKETGSSVDTLSKGFSGFAGNLTGIISGVGAVGAAIYLAKSAYDEFNRVQALSADLYSQFGDQLTYTNAKMSVSIQDATDGMMTIGQAAKSYNLLVNSSIGASVEQVQSMAKASVDIAEKIGGNVDEVMQTMTDSVLSGKTKALKQYGIAIDEANIELDSHIQVMQKYGDTADENDMKSARSRNILEQINNQYKDMIITASDLQDIEQKYKNERDRNAAISAKANENFAKSLQDIKHGFNDLKDAASGYFTGIKYGNEAVKDMINSNQVVELSNQVFDYWIMLEEKYGDLRFDLDIVTQSLFAMTKVEQETNQKLIKRNELNGQSLAQIKEREETNKKDLIYAEKQLEMARKLESVYGAMGNQERAQAYKNLKEVFEGLARTLEGNNKAFADAKLFDIAQKGVAESQKVLKETSDYLTNNSKNIKEYNKMSSDELAKAGDGFAKQAEAVDKQVNHFDDLVKLGKKLTPEEQARYNLLKKQKEELEKQVQFIVKIFEKMTGLKLNLKPDDDDKKGTPPSWLKEYEATLAALKKDDDNLNAAIKEKYGSLDPAKIMIKFQALNDAQAQAEKKILDEYFKNLEVKSAAEAKALDDRTFSETEAAKLESERMEKALEMRRGFLQEVVTEETEKANKIRNLNAKSFEDWSKKENLEDQSNKEKIESVRSFYALQIEIAAEHLEKMRDINNQVLKNESSTLDQKNASIKQLKDAEDALNKVRQEAADKSTEIERARERELKAIRENALTEIKSYGENLVKNGAGALYDAMTISNAALKESYMSRSEMLAKAFKEEMAKIAKEAAIKAMWESALALGSLAIGDQRGFAAHGAAAAMYGTIAGVAYLGAKSISAPSDSEIARRKEKNKESNSITNSKSSVSGTSGGTKVINIYWPNGLVIGDKDTVVREIRKAEDEADRRGQLGA